MCCWETLSCSIIFSSQPASQPDVSSRCRSISGRSMIKARTKVVVVESHCAPILIRSNPLSTMLVHTEEWLVAMMMMMMMIPQTLVWWNWESRPPRQAHAAGHRQCGGTAGPVFFPNDGGRRRLRRGNCTVPRKKENTTGAIWLDPSILVRSSLVVGRSYEYTHHRFPIK